MIILKVEGGKFNICGLAHSPRPFKRCSTGSNLLTEFVVERAEKYGGTLRFSTFKALEEAYAKEEVYPLDLKQAVATQLNKVRATATP